MFHEVSIRSLSVQLFVHIKFPAEAWGRLNDISGAEGPYPLVILPYSVLAARNDIFDCVLAHAAKLLRRISGKVPAQDETTSSFVHGEDVPIPTFPVVSMRIFSAQLVPSKPKTAKSPLADGCIFQALLFAVFPR